MIFLSRCWGVNASILGACCIAYGLLRKNAAAWRTESRPCSTI
ncbi:Uncharacterised protein [Vibrio cholerae]|nr:Uncharacterised protein [Vibrio cholerae]CSI07780.1 Uncharacterised protein [Vibrio cholerae]